MSRVDLGFSEDCDPWFLASYQFPSKIGGKPSWLDLKDLPSSETLACVNCKKTLIFLCQVYAPYEDDEANFHRTLFIFICREADCCVRNSTSNIKVLRCALPRFNEFYSAQPTENEDPNFKVEKWANLCRLCGCLAQKQCSKCKIVNYCSREHQVEDWREGHKSECGIQEKCERVSKLLFSESLLGMEPEEVSEKVIDPEEELKKFKELQVEGKTGTLDDVLDKDLEKYTTPDCDKFFAKFKERISSDNDQVLRYERGGSPLWIAGDPNPEEIPNCEHCGSKRQFEFQIMPQLFTILQEYELDIGIIVVYTCRKSCTDGNKYKEEYVFKQDVALSS